MFRPYVNPTGSEGHPDSPSFISLVPSRILALGYHRGTRSISLAFAVIAVFRKVKTGFRMTASRTEKIVTFSLAVLTERRTILGLSST